MHLHLQAKRPSCMLHIFQGSQLKVGVLIIVNTDHTHNNLEG